MRKLAVLSIICLLGGMAFADEGSVQVRFLDGQGAVITDANLTVVAGGNRQVDRMLGEPEGIYSVKANPNQKLRFELDGYPAAESQMPSQLVGVVEIQIPDPVVPNQAPANDLCADAIGPLAVPSITAGSTAGAGVDAVPACGGAGTPTAGGIWYTVIGTGNLMTITTCEGAVPPGSANYDTKLSVYTGDCAALECIDGNDDDCVGGASVLRSTVTWCSAVGVEYKILVHGFGAGAGDFELSLFDDGVACAEGACCNCDAAPFNCVQAKQLDCELAGRIYAGDFVECFPLLGMPTRYESAPNLPVGYTSPITCDTITVADSYTIGDVNIELDVAHSWIGDLDITVEHLGLVSQLWDNRCGSTVNLRGTADDEGTETLCAAISAGPSNAVFYSNTVAAFGPPLSQYDGLDVMGDWTLCVEDTFVFLDDGTLEAWAVIADGLGTPTCPAQNDVTCFLCGGDESDDTDDGDGDDEDADIARGRFSTEQGSSSGSSWLQQTR